MEDEFGLTRLKRIMVKISGLKQSSIPNAFSCKLFPQKLLIS